ncbi:MAG: type II toxin-antitoxin system VapC family toxin, partial [Chloroflexi bacterium]|nr:type II toxin-antitoxin system VapC family toxin [Chloroflexota bacterium]
AFVDRLFDEALPTERLVVSSFALLETLAGIRRMVRASVLQMRDYQTLAARLSDDAVERITVYPLFDSDITDAYTVVERYGLRAGDALHLSVALAIRAANPPHHIVFVTSDHELLDAALAAGLTTINPEDPEALALLTQLRQGQ